MKKIIVGIDFSNASSEVIAVAAELATGLGSPLHLVHFYSAEPAYVGYTVHNRAEESAPVQEIKVAQERLQALADELEAKGIEAKAAMEELASGVNIKDENTVKSLVEFAEQQDASMLVVGTHGHNFVERLILGSVAEGVIRKATLPVLVVPHRS